MAFRSDVIVDWSVSPRIVTVQAPSTEITIQDLLDTLRELEQEMANIIFNSIISAAGKEALGGGVTVGITATLLDAQVAFEARLTPDVDSTVTTAGTTTHTDSAADFVTAGVQRGSVVINFSDGSISDVLNVIDANNLTVVGLVGGAENDFDVGEDYAVFNVDQCNISGGNLVAVDDLDADISSVLPTFGTQVIRTASSSATLQELEAVQFSSYNGGVTVDVTSSNTGMTFPTGTLQAPVNNFTDALAIADERGFDTFFIIGNATVDTGLDFTNMIFVGQGINLSTLTLDAAANLTNTEFRDATVTGTLDGNSTLQNCEIGSLTFVTGLISECILTGTIVLGGSGPANILNCVDGVAGLGIPIVDMGGDGPDLIVRNYSGGIQIINKTGSAEASIGMNSGRVLIESTVTDGTLLIRGISKVVDNSTGSAVVDVGDMIQPALLNDAITKIALIEKISRNRLETDPATGILTLYDDDNSTVILTGPLFEDVAAAQDYRGQGAERRNRLVAP